MVDPSAGADAGRAIGRYRQTVSDPKPLFAIVGMAVVVYTFAGFFVYWLITGSGTVGIRGRVSDLGSVVWAGPLFAWGAVYLTGRRGPFIRLWREPVTVTVDSQTLTWIGDGTTGCTSWDAVAEIRPSLRVTMRDAVFVEVEAADGRTIACLPMNHGGVPTGLPWWTWLWPCVRTVSASLDTHSGVSPYCGELKPLSAGRPGTSSPKPLYE